MAGDQAIPNGGGWTHSDRLRVLVVRTLLLWFSGICSSHGQPVTEPEATASWVGRQLEERQIPGAIVAFVRGAEPIETLAAGVCDVQAQGPCEVDAPMPVGSVTKMVTGLLAALLAQEGVVDVQVPVANAWADFRLADDRWKRVTLVDLLGNRSGLGSVDWPYYWEPSRTRLAYLEGLATTPMLGHFRSGFHYSNANFIAASRVLELATGLAWERLVETRILQPAGMTGCGFSGEDVAAGYSLDADGNFHAEPTVLSPALAPAGGLICTADSFARLLQIFLQKGIGEGRRVFPAAALDLVTTVATPFGRSGGYGLGVNLTRLREHATVNHLGSSGGHSAAFLLVPEKRFGVVVLVNRTASRFPDALAVALFERSLGGDGDAVMNAWMPANGGTARPSEAARLAPSETAHYLGCYRNPSWGTFVVYEDSGELRIRMGPFSQALVPAEKGSFSFLSAPEWERLSLRFERDAESGVSGFELLDGTHPGPQFFSRGCSA